MLSDTTRLPALMRRVDEAFAADDLDRAETLDSELEILLDDLDHRLSDLEEGDVCDLGEGGDVLDGDNHVGIESQLIAAWSGILIGSASFSLARPADLAAHLREVLRAEAHQGPYAPQPYLEQADDETLILLAADLWNERQALILGTR